MTITKLSESVDEMLESRELFMEHVTREAMGEFITTLLDEQRNLQRSIKDMTSGSNGKAVGTMVKDTANRTSGAVAYRAYVGKLKQNPTKYAFKSEDEKPFATIIETTKRYITLLEDIEKNLDVFFTQKAINLCNTRVSHVVILGVIAEARELYRYGTYLMTAVCESASGGSVAKYREAYMQDNVQRIANVVSRAYRNVGASNFKAMIKDLKDNGIDSTLVDEMGRPVLHMVPKGKIGEGTNTMIGAGILGINLGRILGESRVNVKLDRLRRINDDKEWMDARVNLLKMELDGIDKDSKEYKRLRKIIAKYEAMINASDKKLQKAEK